MKRFVSIAVSVLLACSLLVSCGKEQTNEDQDTVSQMELVQEVPAERIAHETITPATGFSGGDGTKEAPYEISTAAELQYFANLFYGFQFGEGENINTHARKYQEAYYVLTNDIFVNTDAEMENADVKAPTYKWEAVGRTTDDAAVQHMGFQGHFDGQNHFISGLYYCTLGDDYGMPDGTIGFFALLQDATVCNLTIRNSYFYVYNFTNSIGGLASSAADSYIYNCHCEDVKIYAHSSNGTAALVGSTVSTANISNCTVSGEVRGGYSSDIGGITSNVGDGLIANCTNNASIVSFENAIAGGICCTASDVAAAGSIESQNPAQNHGKTQITGCINNGTVTSESFGAGGITARANSGKASVLISACKNNGTIRGNNEVGGIVGTLYAEKSGTDNAAQRIGNFLVENCENVGEVSGETMVGGLVGHTWTDDVTIGLISNCCNFGKISGSNIGGVVGTAGINSGAKLTIDICENKGEICGGAVGGGIVGLFTTTDTTNSGYTFIIKDCKNHGTVSNVGGDGKVAANDAVGGIFGKKVSAGLELDSFIIQSCENTGFINAKSDVYAGGIAGYVLSTGTESIRISDCVNGGNINIMIADNYSEDDVKVYNYVGDIVGTAQDTVVIENCSSGGKYAVTAGDAKRVVYQEMCGLVVNGTE